MTRHRLHKPALITATTLLAITMSAGSGSDNPDDGHTSKNAAVEASKDPNAPTLPLGQVVHIPEGGSTEASGQKRVVDVPGLNGEALSVGTSALTTGTMPGTTAEDGKGRTAPEGGAVLDISIAQKGETPPIGTRPGYAKASKQSITITVEDTAGKTTQIATVKTSATNTHWLASVPKDAATLTLSSDGGKQVVKLSDGTRDDAASNGLPLDEVLTAPVTSATTCDAAPAPATPPSGGVGPSEALGCDTAWYAVDHYDGLGWAPKDKVWLISTVTPKTPQLIKQGNGEFDYQNYSTVENLSITATLDAKKSTVVKSDGGGDTLNWGRTTYLVATPIRATDKPNKLSMQVTVTANAMNTQMTGYPAKVTATLPASITSLDTSATIKTGPNPN